MKLNNFSNDYPIFDDGYVAKSFRSEVEIQYGNKIASTMFRKISIKATRENVNNYVYYHKDSYTEIQCVQGFVGKTKKNFKKYMPIYISPNYNNVLSLKVIAPFSNYFFALFEIPTLKKEQSHELIYKLKMYGNYVELVESQKETVHSFYNLMLVDTMNTSLCFYIPKGINSKISYFEFTVKYNNTLISTDKFYVEDIRNKRVTYHGIEIIEKENKFSVKWEVDKLLKAGTFCTLFWYTEPL